VAIQPGEEILVWYGADYAADLNLLENLTIYQQLRNPGEC
jgi:hypothetical protein